MGERKRGGGKRNKLYSLHGPLILGTQFLGSETFKYLYIQNELSWGWDTYLNTTLIHVS